MNNEKDIIWSLRQWKQEGFPAARQSEIARLLQAVETTACRERAGHILRDAPASAPALRIAVTGSFNCTPMVNLLRMGLFAEGIRSTFHLSDYNQWMQDLGDAKSALYSFSAGITFCLFDDHLIFDEVGEGASPGELDLAADRKLAVLETLAERFSASSLGILAINTIPLPVDRQDNIIDYKTKAALGKSWRRLNTGLLEISERFPQVLVLDVEPLLQRCPEGLSDPRLAVGAGMSWSYGFLDCVAHEGVKMGRALAGKSKKCLVLDLDNTLWGGVLGDAGVNGIHLGREGDGKPFLEFQKRIKHLRRQGVLLAVNSKNEKERVKEMFRTHPDVQLRENDFVDISANWGPKADNMRALAQVLNLGMDSMVFLDDSAFERDFMRTEIPEVCVPEMPDDAAFYSGFALKHGWFNVLRLTGEDEARTGQYLDQRQREGFRQSVASVEDYLRGLGIEISLTGPTDFTLPRMEQICQRTNQFNLTGRRYSQAELEAMRDGGAHLVLGVGGRDRFGEYGMVGLVVVEKNPGAAGEIWIIRNFLLSCRVFSRGIEEEILCYLLGLAKESGVAAVRGEYLPTSRNGNYRDFYMKNGFRPLSEEAGIHTYHHGLEEIMQAKDWVNLIAPEREAA